jgi:hypothetical protein
MQMQGSITIENHISKRFDVLCVIRSSGAIVTERKIESPRDREDE